MIPDQHVIPPIKKPRGLSIASSPLEAQPMYLKCSPLLSSFSHSFRYRAGTPIYLNLYHVLMRFPSFPNIVRTLYTLSNATALRFQQPLRGNTISHFHRATVKSMPSIPFLGALFGTSTPASAKMTYPDQRSDDEWRTVLNKGEPSQTQRPQTPSF